MAKKHEEHEKNEKEPAAPEAAKQAEAPKQPEGSKQKAESKQPDALEQAKAAQAQEHDQFLRLAAEYDNFRKRTQREKDGIYQDAVADTVKKFLPVYDNLERALHHETADEAYKKGVEMTMNQLKTVLEKLGITVPAVEGVGSIVHVAVEGSYAGYLLISDVVKPHSADAIRALKASGVRKTVMLTGDAQPVAQAVAQQLGLDEYHAGLLPGDKVDQIEKLLAEKQPKETLAFVGDGINDAPVLSRADVGIAMGALGSDAAIEAADVVLMDDDPAKIALAMRIARRTLRIVHQNIVFALGIKALCLLLGALGIAGMWAAIFADVGVMVIAVLNATRALYTKDLAGK